MKKVLNKAPEGRQGQYAALYSIGFGLSIIAAPVIGLGIASAYGFENMFTFFILLSIIVATGFMLMGRYTAKKAVDAAIS